MPKKPTFVSTPNDNKEIVEYDGRCQRCFKSLLNDHHILSNFEGPNYVRHYCSECVRKVYKEDTESKKPEMTITNLIRFCAKIAEFESLISQDDLERLLFFADELENLE